jgi:hypothetical protein
MVLCNLLSNGPLRSRLWSLLFLPLFSSVPQAANAEPLPTASELTAKLEKTAERISSSLVRWKERTHLQPGSMTGVEGREVDNFGRPFPAVGLDLTVENELRFDESNWLWKRKGMLWENMLERAARKEYVYFYKNDSFTSFTGVDAKPNEWHSLGYISEGRAQFNTSQFPQIAPMFLLARPFDASFGHLAEDRWTRQEKVTASTINGHECATVRFAAKNGDYEKTCSFARDLDWALVRFTSGRRIKIEFEYDTNNSSEIQLPRSWIFELRSPRRRVVERTVRGLVESWDVNVPVDLKDYEVHFPVGTEVIDFTKLEDGVPKSHLVKVDGIRPITRAERDSKISYVDLLRSRPDQLVLPKTKLRFKKTK